ncbi:MAG: cupin domain-containing protein [Halioglobus sp.]
MNSLATLKLVIEKLNLEAHPIEGGYFTESYRAKEGTLKAALPDRFDGDRSFCSQIYYVISPGRISALHKMLADETWHFYRGSPIKLFEITPEGEVLETLMGSDVLAGQLPQYTVMAENWLGAYNIDADEFSLVGCTVAPAMALDDYEHGKPEELLKQFPQHEELIRKLTWKDDKKPPPILSGGDD